MLEARSITFSHPGAKEPLYRDFDFAVKPGERVALVAPSGFGKTTLCRLLAGYARPQKGQVLVDGVPVAKARGPRLVQLVGQHPERMVDPRMRMSAVLKEAGLIADACASGAGGHARTVGDRSLAASEQVRLANEEAERLLDELGIQRRWLSRYPHELSGGELQRFCIARALAANPRYLVADEISTMLDAVTQAHLWHFLLNEVEARDLGLVFVSHSPALVRRIATRVEVLSPKPC